MNENNLARSPKSFEELKQINQFGAEYWSARDLQPMLGYNHWRSFDNAITKAITSCEKSGNEPGYHFARARKPIMLGRINERKLTEHQFAGAGKLIQPRLQLDEKNANGLIGGEK